jgi:hypothetical protein
MHFLRQNRYPAGNVDYASLSTYPIIILSDIKAVSAGLAQALKTYVSKGGTLVVFPSADADPNSYKAFLQPIGAAYPQNLVTEATKVSAINLQSPVFKSIFEVSPQNPDLPLVKKYYALTSGSRQGEYLMRMQAGQPLMAGLYIRQGQSVCSCGSFR